MFTFGWKTVYLFFFVGAICEMESESQTTKEKKKSALLYAQENADSELVVCFLPCIASYYC